MSAFRQSAFIELGFNSQVQRAVGRIPEKVNGNQDTFWDDD